MVAKKDYIETQLLNQYLWCKLFPRRSVYNKLGITHLTLHL